MGYIGGKTQTDLAAMDDLFIDGVCRLSTRTPQLTRTFQLSGLPMKLRDSV